MSWTDERVELLRKLWNEGLSASQVAAEIGAGITRNAVIGKIDRLGLSQRAKAPKLSVAPRSPPPKTAAPARNADAWHAAQTAPKKKIGRQLPLAPGEIASAERQEPTPVVETAAIPESLRVTLMELRAGMCHWPIGDPTAAEFRFCGAKSPGGVSPYCGYHAQVAYQPAQDRRRTRDKAAAK